jgi:hypothetical protein
MLYSICYVELQLHRVTKFVVLMYIFYLTVICFQYPITSIKSDTFNNITKLYRLSIFVLFCWHSMIYITCIWRLKRLKHYSIFILQLFAFQYIITSIKSDTFNNIANGFCCQYSYFFVFVDILWLRIYVYVWFMLFNNNLRKLFKFHYTIK